MQQLEREFRRARTMVTPSTRWPLSLLMKLEGYLVRRTCMDTEQVLRELLGRLLLVAENRSWVDEVLQVVKERWAVQQDRVDPHHRPEYVQFINSSQKER
ncbi:unnamed protein product [marine sediment metagenome]|uniref:Uncharacterized protein n=1 Tax=marine sediment metagenome TaxID=412755 RepID=X0WKA5_9ZZZZ